MKKKEFLLNLYFYIFINQIKILNILIKKLLLNLLNFLKILIFFYIFDLK